MDMTLEDEEYEQQRDQKRIEKSHSSGTSEDPQLVTTLMPEIIVDILSRLPVESLLRSRSVCKLWCSIISDPHFVKFHLSVSTSNNLYAHHRLIFSTVPTSYTNCLKSCTLYDVLHDGSVNALELDHPLKHPLISVSIAGSCNGLVFIANEDETLFIWNPSTRRSKRLPYTGSRWRPGWFEVFGFGYDESTDDYKVVGISGGYRYENVVKIYSLKTGNWKKTGDIHNGFPIDKSVRYLNGAFHWIASRNSGSSYSLMIISLDLAKETYGEILQPMYDEVVNEMRLGALGEWLTVACDYGRNFVDVWVMKVYGVKDSWTKLFSMTYPTDPELYRFSMPLTLSITNDGKVLLQFEAKSIVYDTKNRSFSEIQNFDECLEAYTFVESLVSPIP